MVRRGRTRWSGGLKQRSLIGEVVYAKTYEPRHGNGKINGYGHDRKKVKPWGAPITVPGVPAILDQATFDAVQQVLGATARGVRKQAPRLYLLSWRLVGTCGKTYAGVFRKDRGGGKRGYRCQGASYRAGSTDQCADRHRINADEIERWTWDRIKDVLSDPARLTTMVEYHLGKRGERRATDKDQLATVQAEIVRREKAIGRLVKEAALAGTLSLRSDSRSEDRD